ncbi:MAG: ribonuclease H-like domain-containing protein [Candidatus Thorarchaeota archaeon]
MTEFYLDFETSGINPEQDKIISIQYQMLDTKTGNARGPLSMLKEWESSEREILKEFLEVLNPSNDWDFVPIGYNLKFELYFLQKRLRRVLRYELSDDWLYYVLPRVDIKSTLILINKGRFKGTTMDWFIRKEMDDSQIPKWYARKDYGRIEEYVEEEAERFLHAYQFLKSKLPSLYDNYEPLP